jgi:hypothetical protein
MYSMNFSASIGAYPFEIPSVYCRSNCQSAGTIPVVDGSACTGRVSGRLHGKAKMVSSLA